MAIAQNYLTIQYTEPNKGNLINHAYHDFVLSMEGAILYQQFYQNITGFKYVLQVWHDEDGKLIEMKVPPNAKSQGLFNTRSIFEDITKTDEGGYDGKRKNDSGISSTQAQISFTTRPHAIHQIDRYARNRQNLRRVYFGLTCEFFSNGVFYETIVKFPKINNKTNFLPFYLLWNACLQHPKEQRGLDRFIDYMLSNQARKFLTNKRTDCVRSVRNTDYETLAFFNGTFRVSQGGHGGVSYNPNFSSVVDNIYIKAYGSGAFEMEIPNISSNCGSFNPIFQSQYVSLQYPASTDEGLLYVGVGCRNIANNGLNDTAGNPVTMATFNGITHYEVWARNNSNAQISEKIRFDVISANCKYESIRIAYLNRLGAYDYFNFIKKSVNRTEITRSNYKANYGYLPLQYNDVNENNHWDYGSYEGGTRSYNVNAIETIEANSDFMNESDATALQELFTSPVCYIQRNGEFEPCVVTEKDYVLQTTDNDKLKQYIVSIQLGNEQRIQRL